MDMISLTLPIPAPLLTQLTQFAEADHLSPEASALALLEQAMQDRMEDMLWDKIAEKRMAEEGHLPRIPHEDAWN